MSILTDRQIEGIFRSSYTLACIVLVSGILITGCFLSLSQLEVSNDEKDKSEVIKEAKAL